MVEFHNPNEHVDDYDKLIVNINKVNKLIHSYDIHHSSVSLYSR